MVSASPERPTAEEYIPYYGQYIRLVPDGDILALLTRQIAETAAFFAAFTPAQGRWRPAPGEWNATEIVGHLADTERVLAYRALRIARADTTPLEGVEDFAPYVPVAGFASRELADVVAEYGEVRRATLSLLRPLDAAAWLRCGMTDGNPISVRALAYLIAGHDIHHVEGLRHATKLMNE